MFVLFFLQSIVIFSFFTFLLLFLCFLSNLVFLHLKLIFWGVLPSLNIFFWPQQTPTILKRSLVNDPAEMTLTNTHACVFYIL